MIRHLVFQRTLYITGGRPPVPWSLSLPVTFIYLRLQVANLYRLPDTHLEMLLNIPILDLLHSQLDIGVDPLSGKLTYNIKNIPSRLRQYYRSLHASDLTLTLQSSPEDGRSGLLSIRISPAQVAVSGHSSTNMSEGSSRASGGGTSGNHALCAQSLHFMVSLHRIFWTSLSTVRIP